MLDERMQRYVNHVDRDINNNGVYRCHNCGAKFDAGFSNSASRRCPECGAIGTIHQTDAGDNFKLILIGLVIGVFSPGYFVTSIINLVYPIHSATWVCVWVAIFSGLFYLCFAATSKRAIYKYVICGVVIFALMLIWTFCGGDLFTSLVDNLD